MEEIKKQAITHCTHTELVDIAALVEQPRNPAISPNANGGTTSEYRQDLSLGNIKEKYLSSKSGKRYY